MDYKQMKVELTKILSQKTLNSKSISMLNQMGFTLEDGKHYKMYYHGHKEEFVTVSKTLSDSGHGGKNLVSVTMRMVKKIDEKELSLI